MRKFLKRSLATTMVLSLAASASLSVNAAAEETTYTIANAPKCIGISWWDRMDSGNRRFAEATGNTVYQSGPTGDADTAVQIASIEDAIASGVDAINVIPYDPVSCETTLAKARDNGIVVISHEAEGMENVDYDLEAFVNQEYGAHMMDLLAEQMGEKGGYVIMVGGLTSASHQQWAEGAIARQEEAYPDMFQVCDLVEGSSQEAAYNTAKEVIATYPEIGGFIGCDTNDPPGIAMAVEEAGKAGEIAVTGTCLVSQARDYLNNGTIKKFTFWDPADAGEAMCSLAVKVLKGDPIEDGVDLGVAGYEKCTVKDNTIYGAAWVDVTTDNMSDYDF
ncbi:MAG: autoinducer 2 ABC transporter substrate-binding protein [Lachnospiraceae bacterium]|nr:autoinducer 2 ABC transporter substrate-binding protein [Lachnospiraceae bacterium]